VTGVVIAEIVPVPLLAPVAGALIDRLPRVKGDDRRRPLAHGARCFAVTASGATPAF